MNLAFLKNYWLILFFLSGIGISHAQVVWTGFKIGGQLNSAKIDDNHFRDSVKSYPTVGFNAGFVLAFKVKDRYFLQTEYTYSTKGKILKGKLDPDLRDELSYRYVESSILFTRQSKVMLGSGRNFKLYYGVGPNIAYLLSGNGKIRSSELLGEQIQSISYKIRFDTRQDRNHVDQVHYTSANRLQFGINLGAGMIIEPAPKRKIVLDLRYTFDQTLFGKKNADYLLPDDYRDNLRFRNRTLRFSIMYLLEYNSSKKSRHTGKSNKRIK